VMMWTPPLDGIDVPSCGFESQRKNSSNGH
jgi:hypothetical protein